MHDPAHAIGDRQDVHAIRAAYAFDGTRFLPGGATILVEGDRIEGVEPGWGEMPEHVEVAEYAGTVLPGLFDCHVHVMTRDFNLARAEQQAFSLQYYEGKRNLSLLLDQGITSARDAAGADLGVKQAIAQELIEGPRLQIAISMLSQTGGHGDVHLPSGGRRSIPMMTAHPGRPHPVVDGPLTRGAPLRAAWPPSRGDAVLSPE